VRGFVYLDPPFFWTLPFPQVENCPLGPFSNRALWLLRANDEEELMTEARETDARRDRREAIINAAYDLDPALVLLRTSEAADILSVSPSLLRRARVSGQMLGRPAPTHVQLDTTIRYRLSDLTEWLESALMDATRGAQAHAY